MAWLTSNWFWILIAVAFIGMHMFGHGGHGAHGGHTQQDGDASKDPAGASAEKPRAGGHHH